jgi:hypothetical protein
LTYPDDLVHKNQNYKVYIIGSGPCVWQGPSLSTMGYSVSILPDLKIVQNYDALENIENPTHPLELTLGSSTDTNLGHTTAVVVSLKIKKPYCSLGQIC